MLKLQLSLMGDESALLSSTLYPMGMDEVLAHYAGTFEDLYSHLQ